MKKTWIFVLSAFLSSGAWAGWENAVENSTGGLTVYVDSSTIHRSGTIAKMWVLFDYKNREKWGDQLYKSTKMQEEFDCAEERSRNIYLIVFVGNMGDGKVITAIDKPDIWAPIGPDSIGEHVWQVACGKR